MDRFHLFLALQLFHSRRQRRVHQPPPDPWAADEDDWGDPSADLEADIDFDQDVDFDPF